jgi:hypothetical protein
MCKVEDERLSKHYNSTSRTDEYITFDSVIGKQKSLDELEFSDEGSSDDDISYKDEIRSLDAENLHNELMECRRDTDTVRNNNFSVQDDGIYQRHQQPCQTPSTLDGYENSVKITVVTQDFYQTTERINIPIKQKAIPKRKVTTNSRPCAPWNSILTTLNEINVPPFIANNGCWIRSPDDPLAQYQSTTTRNHTKLHHKSMQSIVASLQWICDRFSKQITTATIIVDDWDKYRRNAVIALTNNIDLNPFKNDHKIGEPQLVGRKRKTKSTKYSTILNTDIFARSNRQNNDEHDETDSSTSTSSNQESASACINAVTSSGILGKGVPYQITRIIMVGWLYKKGTGMDIMQSFSWKVRYAKLCLAYVYNEDYGDGVLEVPLLCLYWYERSSTPCTIVVLDTAVALSVKQEDVHVSKAELNKEIMAKLNNSLNSEEKYGRNLLPPSTTTPLSKSNVPSVTSDKYFFELRHATSKQNSTLPMTRSFATLSTNSRDEWVYRISEALLTYNKAKQVRRKIQLNAATYVLRSPQRFPSCVVAQAMTTVGGSNTLPSQEGKTRIEDITYKISPTNASTKKVQLSTIDPLDSVLNSSCGKSGVRSSGSHNYQMQEVMPISISNATTSSLVPISKLATGTNRNTSLDASVRPPTLPIRFRPSSPTRPEMELTID